MTEPMNYGFVVFFALLVVSCAVYGARGIYRELVLDKYGMNDFEFLSAALVVICVGIVLFFVLIYTLGHIAMGIEEAIGL